VVKYHDYHLENLGIDGRIILEWTLEKYGGRCKLDSSGSGWRPVVSSCEYGNEALVP